MTTRLPRPLVSPLYRSNIILCNIPTPSLANPLSSNILYRKHIPIKPSLWIGNRHQRLPCRMVVGLVDQHLVGAKNTETQFYGRSRVTGMDSLLGNNECSRTNQERTRLGLKACWLVGALEGLVDLETMDLRRTVHQTLGALWLT